MTAQKKKPALDIFELLAAVDKRDFNFYSKLTPEQKKAFAPIVAMRWMTAIRNSDQDSEFQLQIVNEVVNQNMWNSALYNHPELIYKLMAVCGSGKRKNYEWIKGFSKEKKSKMVEFLRTYYPSASKSEIEYLISINSKEQLIDLVKDSGLQDDEAAVLIKDIKEVKK